MDYRPNLSESRTVAAGETLVQAEQAVFTSVRSPTGEGYRIIAASNGVRAEEKVEITRRSPSHGSLDDESAAAFGLSSYRLESGRYCVASSRYAGTEHTARGGGRVYTHIAVLDEDSFVRFLCNPFRISAAVEAQSDGNPLLKPATELEPLHLSFGWPSGVEAVNDPADAGMDPGFDGIRRLVTSLMERKRLVVVAERNRLALLEWSLLCLPMFIRKRVAVSVGLNFSPSREFDVTVLPARDVGTNRAIRGHQTEWLDLGAPATDADHSEDPWLQLLGEWWKARRFSEIRSLSSRLSLPVDRSALGRIAHLCWELDRIDEASEDELESILVRHAGTAGRNDVEDALLGQIIELSRCRLAALDAGAVAGSVSSQRNGSSSSG